VRDVLLLDVTPLTLGIETLGGVGTPLITRNTTIPTSKSQIFTTASDSQTSVEIHVLQGERPMAGDNKSLGRFVLDGLLPAPRGMPQVEVSFDLDANGILSVRAQDKGTGKEQKIVIHPSSGLNKDEVDKMRREAETYASQDVQKKEAAELKNSADSLIYSLEKTLREQGDKVPADLRQEVESKITQLRSALTGNDPAAIRRLIQELTETAQKIGASVYQTAGTPSGEAPPEQKPPEGTIEGEYREA
ncbi:MAG: Hsp70 family protein, partial [Chloroflexota bacterium]